MSAVLTVLLAATAPVHAPVPASPEADLVDVTVGLCYGLATGSLKLGESLDQDTKVLEGQRIGFGVSQPTMDRMGREGIGLIAAATIGERKSGDSTVVVAVGGRMPGCRSILLSNDADGLEDRTAELLTAAGWKEAPATNPPGTVTKRRMFVRRSADGQPYLINLISGSIPQSDFRIMTTVNAIPPGVELPQGF